MTPAGAYAKAWFGDYPGFLSMRGYMPLHKKAMAT
jgi:hypothetical protein